MGSPNIFTAETTDRWVISIPSFRIKPRSLYILLAVISAIAMLDPWIPAIDNPALIAAKFFISGISALLLPGIVVMETIHLAASMTLFEYLAVAVAVSFGFCQSLILLAVIFHIPTPMMATLLCLFNLAAFIRISFQKTSHSPLIRKEELSMLPFLLFVLLFAYAKGSAFIEGEHGVHISIVRRLIFIPDFKIENMNFWPNEVFTHPFSGIHYVMALITRISGLDPIFIYHKLRFFWTFASLLCLYSISLFTFERMAPAMAILLTGCFFVLNGCFADMSSLFVGQLSPQSHLADISMGVVLPCLIVATFHFLKRQRTDENYFFYLLILSLVGMIIMSHIREIVQYVVYLGSFFLGLLFFRRDAGLIKKSAMLIVTCLAFAILYNLWVRVAIPHVADLVQSFKGQLISAARDRTWKDYFAAFYDSYFMQVYPSFFYGWNPIAIALSPLIFLAAAGNTFMLFVGMSVLMYALIMRFTFMTLPYIYFTYQEVLIFPIRVFLFFVYLFTGAIFFFASVGIARSRNRWLAGILIVLTALLLKISWKHTGIFFENHFGMLFSVIILGFMVAMGLIWRGHGKKIRQFLFPEKLPRTWPVVLIVLLVIAGRLTHQRFNALIRLDKVMLTPASLFREMECQSLVINSIPDDLRKQYVGNPAILGCPPPQELAQWMTQHVSTDAILAVSAFNPYSASTFMPQKVAVWPFGDNTASFAKEIIFPYYFTAYEKSITEKGTQPFFNQKESLEQKVEFIKAQGITHILIDPMYYDEMKKHLNSWPDTFRAIYDNENWMVYEFISHTK